MRLRLVVKRHDLPDAAILWPIEDSTRLIISQLLEQVNEVIPLESEGEWGLEDYAVEIRGKETNYECLHFQNLKSILHEDDEVLIRPLLSDDLKQRRASGRCQITSDGKHLFDGAVFGKPRRRMIADRPSVIINPRKRRRVTYADDDDLADDDSDESPLRIEKFAQEIEDGGNRQLVIRADFENDDEEDEDEDDVFESPDEDLEEDLSVNESELEGEIEALNAESEDAGASDKENVKLGTKRDGAQQDSQNRNIAQLQEAFPNAPMSVCQHVLKNCGMDVGAAYDTLSKGFKPEKSKTSVRSTVRTSLERVKAPKLPHAQERSAEGLEKDIDVVYERRGDFDEADDEDDEDGNSNVGEDNDVAGYYDNHGLPPGSINIGKGLSDAAKSTVAQITKISLSPSRSTKLGRSDFLGSNKSVRFTEEALPVQNPDEIPIDDDSDDSEDEDFNTVSHSENSESDSPSSSDSSNSDSDAESGDLEEKGISAVPPAVDTSDQSSSGSDSPSSSESDSDSSSESDYMPEETSSKIPIASEAPNQSKQSPKKSTTTVPYGEGRKSTKARNQRRRSANILQRFKDKGILPAGVTLAELGRLDINNNTTPEDAAAALAIARAEIEEEKSSKRREKDAEFEARRQELLASLASGGVDVESISASETVSIAPPNETGGDSLVNQQPTVPDMTDNELVSTAFASRKSKLNLPAGRRLVFGALGIKHPKTKTDEENIRNALMNDVRQITNPEPIAAVTSTDDVDVNPEAWREKIILRAVECCQEGIILSEPPFPFVQRWDPQQQNGYRKGKRGGKGKRSQRNQTQYYGEDEQSSVKKRKRKHDDDGPNGYYDYIDNYEEEQNYNQSPALDGTDENEGAISQAKDQIMEDAQGVDSQLSNDNDLPTLPADVSSLPGIDPKDMKPGMVVAFKQLIMSETTSWQPVISGYRTGVVNIVTEKDGVELTLAMRDREYPEKYYDQETGERIYGRFDMPVDEEEEDDDLDDGYRILGFSEIIEPKLVQPVPEDLDIMATSGAKSDKVTTSTDDSTTLVHEQHDSPKETIDATPVADEDRIFEQDLEHEQAEVNSPPRLSDHTPTLPHALPLDENIGGVSISEESRQEISVLMKEAGFRSGIPSPFLRDRPQVPYVSIYSDASGSFMKRTATTDTGNNYSFPVGTSAIDVVKDSQTKSQTETEYKEPSSQPSIVEEENASTPTPPFSYPQLSVPSSLASQITDHGQRQPDFPTPGESTLERFGNSDSFQRSHEDQSQISLHSETLPYEPHMSSPHQNHGTPTSQGPSPTSRPSSPISELPSLDDVFSTARSSNAAKREKSQSVTTHIPSTLNDDKEYEATMAELDAEMDAQSDPNGNLGNVTPRANHSSQVEAINYDSPKPAKKQKSPNRKKEVHNKKMKSPHSGPVSETRKNNSASSPFVIPAGSQQVDLTLSSDIEADTNAEKDDTDDDTYVDLDLPRGPGWVQKRKKGRPKRKTTGNDSQSSGSQTQTRTQRRQTMKF